MGKKDSKPISGTNGSSAKGKHLHEGHKTTAATLAKVAAKQDEIRQKESLETDCPPRAPPKDTSSQKSPSPTNQVAPRRKLLQRQLTSGKSVMAPIALTTATAISRIADNGAPPTKSTSPSATMKVPRVKATPKSSTKSSFKSQNSDASGSRGLSRLNSHPASPASGSLDNPPPLPDRPAPQRSTSAEGGSLLSIVKKRREQIQSGGLGAAKFLGKKGQEAWGKIKKGKNGHSGLVGSPYSGGGNASLRDSSNDIDVFGMDLREAVQRTRIVKERKGPADAAYWMPALAYRCLQYLNVHGPHELGIYRISGSTSVVDDLRADFKIQHDVDLFDNPPDDLHTVSSLLKGWFRSLPEAVLPPEVQKRVYEKCKDQTDAPKPPQAFIDELSQLPPYNYYLLHHLFSHLSAVCGASDVNKMNLANLGMIFCSTLRIDRFCFNWLVGSWEECWAGCKAEEEEYRRVIPSRQPSTASSGQSQYHDASSAPESRSTSQTNVDRYPSNSSSARPQKTPSPEPRSLARSLSRVGRRKGGSSKDSKERKKEKSQPSPPPPQEPMPGAYKGGGKYKDSDQSSLQVETGRPPKSSASEFSLAVDAQTPRLTPNGSSSADRLDLKLPGIQPVSPMMRDGAML
ncbi:Rho GTPase activation protein [Choiromyces venosus 120613-1]|uniref:Rho GTPase activation protein n=1 Tax=Choiromyces venosus 120613-1 TaxID=1336337 RepID=A0A3N4J6Q1_9PEZI|nr:Rho GTPase activation protein [Choiromyces venosus 120613-1]